MFDRLSAFAPRRKHMEVLVLIALASLVGGCSSLLGGSESNPSVVAADLVLFGEHIYTVDASTPDATAVAVRGDRIVAVGSRTEVEGLVGEATRVVELGEKTLVPGFIDTHGHFGMVMQMLSLMNASSPPVGPMESIEDIVAAFKKRIEGRDDIFD